jgi:hypothetical protein
MAMTRTKRKKYHSKHNIFFGDTPEAFGILQKTLKFGSYSNPVILFLAGIRLKMVAQFNFGHRFWANIVQAG